MFFPILVSSAVLCSVPRGSTESTLGCILAHVRYVPIVVAFEALGNYTIPIIGFAFIDLVVLD